MKSSKAQCRWFGVFAISIAVLSFSGCNRVVDYTEPERLQRARSFRDEGKLQASVIELKNVLQKNPDNAQARLLLGEVYLDLWQSPNAEKGLLKAKQLGAAED